jgi:hypothetical protein
MMELMVALGLGLGLVPVLALLFFALWVANKWD